MKTIKITDCYGQEQNLNVDFIYNITEIIPETAKDKVISVIHLNHKDDDYSFFTFKTHEVKSNLLKRLEQYK